jgi:hypothetical protein
MTWRVTLKRALLVLCLCACKHRAAGPTVLAAETRARSLALAGGYVYWVEDSAKGAVRRVPVAGGRPETLLAEAPPWPIAAAGDDVYAGSGDAIVRVTGGPPSPLASVRVVDALTADALSLYWSDGSAVWQAPRAGGPSRQVAVGQAGALAATGGEVRFTLQAAPTQILRGAPGSPPKRLATASAPVEALALDGDTLVWLAADGTIERLTPGGEPVVLAKGSFARGLLAAAGGRVWAVQVSSPREGDLCEIGPGKITPRAHLDAPARALVADPDAAYVAVDLEYTRSRILRVKP